MEIWFIVLLVFELWFVIDFLINWERIDEFEVWVLLEFGVGVGCLVVLGMVIIDLFFFDKKCLFGKRYLLMLVNSIYVYLGSVSRL